MTETLSEVVNELEAWMTETCSRSIYSDIEVRDRLFELWLSLTKLREDNMVTADE